MNSNDFCYLLKGYLELAGTDDPLTTNQMKIINDHLNLVFNKVTPDRIPSGNTSPYGYGNTAPLVFSLYEKTKIC
jgi:hypothetical protein